MAQPSQDGIKEKVLAVREVVPGRSNNEIVLVLTYYDYSVEGAIQAFLEDGAKAALEEWHYPGNKPSNKKKKKKQQQKKAEQAAKDAAAAAVAAAAAAAAAAASGDSKQSTATVAKEIPVVAAPESAAKKVELTQNGQDESKSKRESVSPVKEVKPDVVEVPQVNMVSESKPVEIPAENRVQPKVLADNHIQTIKTSAPKKSSSEAFFEKMSKPAPVPNAPSRPQSQQRRPHTLEIAEVVQVNGVSESKPAEIPAENRIQPMVSADSHVQTKTSAPKNSSSEAFLEKMSKAAPVANAPSRPQSQQRRPHTLETSSTRAARERSVSEVSVSSAASSTQSDRTVKVKPHAGLEKSTKDLQRQTLSLQRLKHILAEEVEKSFKTMSAVFEDLRLALNEREAELMFDMDKVKVQANETLQQRQNRAVELKVRTNRAPGMSDAELAELRADIKHFVSERKIDEDLTKSARFVCESQGLLTQIKAFGEISPVKHAYSLRRPSVTSVSSSIVSHDEPLTPLTPTSPAFSASSNATTVSFLSHSNPPSASPTAPATSSHDMAMLTEKFTSAVSTQNTRPATPTQKSASTSPVRPIQSAASAASKLQESDTDNGDVRKPRNARRRLKQRHRERGSDSFSSESSTTVASPTPAPSDNLERKRRPQQNGPRPVSNRGTSPMKQSAVQAQGRQGHGQSQEGQQSNSRRGGQGQGQRNQPQGPRDRTSPATDDNEQEARPQYRDSQQYRQGQGQAQGQFQRRPREKWSRGPRPSAERNGPIANGVANGDGTHHQETNNIKPADARGERSRVPLKPNDLKVNKLDSSPAQTADKPAAANDNHKVIENGAVENAVPKAQRGPRNRGARHILENRKSQVMVNGDCSAEFNGHS